MANYFDNSHIDGKQLTPQQIADAIRHKKFGVDVREAMAQGLEYCMTQAQKVDKLEQDIGTINDEINKLNLAVFGNGATEVPIENRNPDIETNRKARGISIDYDNDKR